MTDHPELPEDPEELVGFFQNLLANGQIRVHALEAPVPAAKPVKTVEGRTGRIRWEYWLYDDEIGKSAILVEKIRRVHPRVHIRLRKALHRVEVLHSHNCAEGDPDWYDTLHIIVPASEPCEEIAIAVAEAIDSCRLGFWRHQWLRFRRWLAEVILPEGLDIE